MCCRASEADLSVAAAGRADAATEVLLKICREGRVQKVAIQLAQDHGLGTRRLVHWCGAQFQVRSLHLRVPVIASRALMPCVTDPADLHLAPWELTLHQLCMFWP